MGWMKGGGQNGNCVTIPRIMMVPNEFILASNSPRRRELLGFTGSQYQVIPAEVDEDTQQGESAPEYVLRLAESKARAVGIYQNNGFIIAADTTVVDDGQILGKPIDDKDAHRMLTQLRGRTHKVYTALAVMDTDDGSLSTDLCLTEVPMRQYSDSEIKNYIDSGDPLVYVNAFVIATASCCGGSCAFDGVTGVLYVPSKATHNLTPVPYPFAPSV